MDNAAYNALRLTAFPPEGFPSTPENMAAHWKVLGLPEFRCRAHHSATHSAPENQGATAHLFDTTRPLLTPPSRKCSKGGTGRI